MADPTILDDVPERLAHLSLRPFFGKDRVGLGPARVVWPYLWTYRRPPGFEVFPGDTRTSTATGIERRQLQDAFVALEHVGAIERVHKPRGRVGARGRVFELKPREIPRGGIRAVEVPPCADVRARCIGKRPHMDVSMLLYLFMLAASEWPTTQWSGGWSPLLWVQPRVLRHMLAIGKNTPRRSLARLAQVQLIRPRSRDGDLADGFHVAGCSRWASANSVAQRGARRPSQRLVVPAQGRPRAGVPPPADMWLETASGEPPPYLWRDVPPPDEP